MTLSRFDQLDRLRADELDDQERRWEERAARQSDRVKAIDEEIEALTRERIHAFADALRCHTQATIVRLAKKRAS